MPSNLVRQLGQQMSVSLDPGQCGDIREHCFSLRLEALIGRHQDK